MEQRDKPDDDEQRGIVNEGNSKVSAYGAKALIYAEKIDSEREKTQYNQQIISVQTLREMRACDKKNHTFRG